MFKKLLILGFYCLVSGHCYTRYDYDSDSDSNLGDEILFPGLQNQLHEEEQNPLVVPVHRVPAHQNTVPPVALAARVFQARETLLASNLRLLQALPADTNRIDLAWHMIAYLPVQPGRQIFDPAPEVRRILPFERMYNFTIEQIRGLIQSTQAAQTRAGAVTPPREMTIQAHFQAVTWLQMQEALRHLEVIPHEE